MFFSRGFFEDKGSIYGDDYSKIYSVDRDSSGVGLLTRCKVGDIYVLVSGHEYSYVNFLLGEGLSYLKENRAELLSLGLDFVPVIGNLKVLLESVYGRDFLTGRDLGRFERGMGLGLVLLPQAKNAGKFGKKFIPGTILKGAKGLGRGTDKYVIKPAKIAAGWVKEKTYRGARRISGGLWGMLGYETAKAGGKVFPEVTALSKCLVITKKALFIREVGGKLGKMSFEVGGKKKMVYLFEGSVADSEKLFFMLVDKCNARRLLKPMPEGSVSGSWIADFGKGRMKIKYRPKSTIPTKQPFSSRGSKSGGKLTWNTRKLSGPSTIEIEGLEKKIIEIKHVKR